MFAYFIRNAHYMEGNLTRFVNNRCAMQNTHSQFLLSILPFIKSEISFVWTIKKTHKALSCFDTSCTYIRAYYNLRCFIGVVEVWLQFFLFRYLYRCCIFFKLHEAINHGEWKLLHTSIHLGPYKNLTLFRFVTYSSQAT